MTQYIKKYVPTKIMKNIYQNHVQQHNTDTYKIYTDGSKTEQGVAFAVYSENFSTSKRMSYNTSIFTAELHGILETNQLQRKRSRRKHSYSYRLPELNTSNTKTLPKKPNSRKNTEGNQK